MTEEKQMLYMVQGTINELPEDQKAKVHEIADAMTKLISDSPGEGAMALALVGSTFAEEASRGH